MPTNISGRITLTIVVLLTALWAIFPSAPKALVAPFKKDVQWSFKPALKPGIDMVGGTSLLYEIKVPAGSSAGNLAEEVMEALKKRVDPDGVRNLVWRPQGSNRLEIQMPLGGTAPGAKEKREAYAAAQRELERLDVRLPVVLDAVEQLTGDARRDRLNALAKGNTRRAEVFGAMASMWDQIKAAEAARDFAKQATLENQYESLKRALDETNFSVAQVETIMAQTKTSREDALKEVKDRFVKQSFTAKTEAIDRLAAAYDAYEAVRGAIDDGSDLKRLLRGSGVLEFHILVTAAELKSPEAQVMIDRLLERGPRIEAGDTMRWMELAQPDEFSRTYQIFSPRGSEKSYALVWAIPGKQMINAEGLPRWALESASPTRSQMGALMVAFSFDAVGARLFSDLTGANIGLPLAMALDEKIISAPNINSQIGRHGTIEGGQDGFKYEEVRYLVSTLSAGSLPAQLNEEPISERTVGPQLGEDNLRAGFLACIFGLIVVAVFLIGYYYLSGVVAMIAVVMNLILVIGMMAALQATFTLAGVAGLVLSIGMAVDANVLIFERLREEQFRGMGIRLALRNAYDRAWSAILDGNVTTAITSLFLMWLGSEEVKGFGLTLLLGILSSLFTALFVTRTIFAMLVDKFGVKKLGSLPMTFPKWDRILRPNVDWMKLAPLFYWFSAVFVVIGLTLFVIRFSQGRVLDVEFAQGTAAQFELREPMKIEDVRRIINAASESAPEDLPSPSVVSVGADDKSYEVVTPNAAAEKVKNAIMRAMAGKLNLQQPSRFADDNSALGESLNGSVFPIETRTTSVAGLQPEKLRENVGGAAIVLRNLTPMLSAEEISKRLDQQRLQPGAKHSGYRKYDVEVFPEQSTAVVLVSDEALPYDKDVDRWTRELAEPAWSLVKSAVNNPVELQKVTNFDPQVAGETQTQALLALSLSMAVIVAYIWMRFGNLRYGAATIVALLHDTLFVLAAVGVAHYLSEIAFMREVFLLEPFRLNLTMVAAILTVMGYSMNDTVVVFDRIRENRGKSGVVTRQLINDSVNQTLSRTLLTGGTTLVTILLMYITGGPGIHGFTFSLVVGIIVGTYSSIAIASPLLLIGQKQPPSRTKPTTPRERELVAAT